MNGFIHIQCTKIVYFFFLFFTNFITNWNRTPEPIAWQPAQKCCSKCIARNLAHLQAHEVSEASESWTCSNASTEIPTGNLCVSQQQKWFVSVIDRNETMQIHLELGNSSWYFHSLSFLKCKLIILHNNKNTNSDKWFGWNWRAKAYEKWKWIKGSLWIMQTPLPTWQRYTQHKHISLSPGSMMNHKWVFNVDPILYLCFFYFWCDGGDAVNILHAIRHKIPFMKLYPICHPDKMPWKSG